MTRNRSRSALLAAGVVRLARAAVSGVRGGHLHLPQAAEASTQVALSRGPAAIQHSCGGGHGRKNKSKALQPRFAAAGIIPCSRILYQRGARRGWCVGRTFGYGHMHSSGRRDAVLHLRTAKVKLQAAVQHLGRGADLVLAG